MSALCFEKRARIIPETPSGKSVRASSQHTLDFCAIPFGWGNAQHTWHHASVDVNTVLAKNVSSNLAHTLD